MASAWLREEQASLAADKILDAAARAFAELGVSCTGMAEIARYAGCSRGTLYRYFKNRHELHVAFMNREALRIVARLSEELAEIDDPAERLTVAILGSVREVRARPETAAWFTPVESGVTARMSRRSEVVDAILAGGPSDARGGDEASRLRARWILRVIVSLLTMPGDSEVEERELVERFVVPGLAAGVERAAEAERARGNALRNLEI